MRRAARTDDNQAEIVAALSRVGASVEDLSMIGHGCPDLLVGLRGRNYLLEVKDGSKSPSRRVLTADQETYHRLWRGEITVVNSLDEALAALGMGAR